MTPSPRVLITPYLNARAFVHHGAPRDCELVPCAPRQAATAMLRGEALAAIVPVGGLARLRGSVELLGNYGIACRGASRSVLLFSARPFAALDASTRLALSAESMSSVRLLFVLLERRAGHRSLPRPAAPGEQSDAELVIGDAALARAATARMPHVTDLATQWFLATGRPMVFARWVVSRRATIAQRACLRGWLDAYAADEARLRRITAARDHARAGLGADDAHAYLHGIRCVLDADDLAGQALYQRELRARPWLEDLVAPTAHREELQA